ncbi:40164_t:CDS:2, partial [Gigaspora margarita]
ISEGENYNDAVVEYQAILEERENKTNDIDKYYTVSEKNKTDNSDNETLDNEASNIQLSQNIQNSLYIVEKGQLSKRHYMSSIKKNKAEKRLLPKALINMVSVKRWATTQLITSKVEEEKNE